MAEQSDFRPFKQLLRLIVRAFYPTQCPPLHHQEANDELGRSRLAKIETNGLGVVLIDYLLDHEWVAEEQIATDLGQHFKLLRRALKFLEAEHLVMSHSQRETKRTQKRDLVRQAVDGHTQDLKDMSLAEGKEEDEEEAVQKHHTYSYWAIDFPRAMDMIQLRLHVMKKTLKDELDAKEVVARYACKTAHCLKEYSSYDIMDILQPDGTMICAMCGGNVEQVLATGQTGDEEQRKKRKERLTKLYKDMERQLEPLHHLVQNLKHVQPPHHGTITDWARMQQARKEAGIAGSGAGGADAGRVRTAGGITQLTEAGGAARTRLYAETHVQVTLDTAEPETAATGSAAGTAAANAPVLGVSNQNKAPSLQPFFLKGASGANPSTQANDSSQAGTSSTPPLPTSNDDGYTAKMLELMGGGRGEADDEPAFKKAKTEPGEEDDWEDI